MILPRSEHNVQREYTVYIWWDTQQLIRKDDEELYKYNGHARKIYLLAYYILLSGWLIIQ